MHVSGATLLGDHPFGLLTRAILSPTYTQQKQESSMSMLTEFKAFAVKGNVIDMAVGIIIGAAFGKIVSSFVGDVMMPPIGVMLGGVDFASLSLVIQAAVGDTPEVVIRYGKFIQTFIDFLIIGFSLFLAIKGINSMKQKEEAAPKAPPAPSKEELLLAEIRDLLKGKSSD
jgi:large conductance mechanosensitive channel